MGNYASSMRSVKVLSIATTLSAVQSQDPNVTVGNFTFISSYSSYTPSFRCEGLLLGSGSITIAGSIDDDKLLIPICTESSDAYVAEVPIVRDGK